MAFNLEFGGHQSIRMHNLWSSKWGDIIVLIFNVYHEMVLYFCFGASDGSEQKARTKCTLDVTTA